MGYPVNPTSFWCVGRNYREHAAELNNPVPATPLIFLKSGSCANWSSQITLPTWTDDIHHECELAVEINHRGEPQRLTLALDMTARKVQSELKKKAEPWTLAKSFTGACPIAPWSDFKSWERFAELRFQLEKNGSIVQQGFAGDMIFPLLTLLEHLRSRYPLADGDVVLTGTPSGVGPVVPGDRLKASIDGLQSVTWVVN